MTKGDTMRRHYTHAEAKAVHAVIAEALNLARVRVQDYAAHAGLDLASADWEVADAARRWGAALQEELSPGPLEDDRTGEHVRIPVEAPAKGNGASNGHGTGI